MLNGYYVLVSSSEFELVVRSSMSQLVVVIGFAVNARRSRRSNGNGGKSCPGALLQLRLRREAVAAEAVAADDSAAPAVAEAVAAAVPAAPVAAEAVAAVAAAVPAAPVAAPAADAAAGGAF